MKSIKLKIKNEQGLHARPSTKFVNFTENFNGDISVIANGERVDGKNIMGLMLLSLGLGDEFVVEADSITGNEEDEIDILSKLKNLVEVLKFNE